MREQQLNKSITAKKKIIKKLKAHLQKKLNDRKTARFDMN